MTADVVDRSGQFRPSELREPPWARFLFADTRASVLWLVVRLYLGWQWLQAGIEKLDSPLWTGRQSGVALTGFIKGAVGKTGGPNPAVQDWYASFLQSFVLPHASLWSHLVAYGETAVGVALILGVLTGIAAFFGIVMNANYLLAGAVSTNPILIILGTLVMLAWRNAGWLGLDRWLLPLLGTPWQPGAAFTVRPGPGDGVPAEATARPRQTGTGATPRTGDRLDVRREGPYDGVEMPGDQTRTANPDLGDGAVDEAANTGGSAGAPDGGNPLV